MLLIHTGLRFIRLCMILTLLPVCNYTGRALLVFVTHSSRALLELSRKKGPRRCFATPQHRRVIKLNRIIPCSFGPVQMHRMGSVISCSIYEKCKCKSMKNLWMKRILIYPRTMIFCVESSVELSTSFTYWMSVNCKYYGRSYERYYSMLHRIVNYLRIRHQQ